MMADEKIHGVKATNRKTGLRELLANSLTESGAEAWIHLNAADYWYTHKYFRIAKIYTS
jgi:hypothetical protein